MEMQVNGYSKIEYTLDDLKAMCPKCYKKNEIESNPQIKNELQRLKLYHSKIYNNTNIPVLDGEIWKDLKDIEGFTKYSVSNKGRVKVDEEILVQEDEVGKYGYLLLDPKHTRNVSHSTYVYTLVAYAFLGKKPNDGKHVHHIDNNGYDCRPENLILLDSEQHSYVHGFSCETYNDKEKSDCV